jgi:hypothetical protein
VRGFSPAEMALPNHPDVAYEFVKTLNDCGYQWLLVQEHTVELPDGRPLERPHLPHRLVCTSSAGERAEIVAVVKTQGSDTKLVGQLQPYYEAKGLSRLELAGRLVPPLVTQIADGENGGVMMNEFPAKYLEVVRACSGSRTPMLNVTEYLEQLFATGIEPADLPAIQPLDQHRIWEQMAPGDGPERLAGVVEQLRREDGHLHMEGGSWTNDRSWVRGYDQVLIPMEHASLPHGPVPPAGGRDQLLPLLGRGCLDRLRRRAVPSRRRHRHPRTLRPDGHLVSQRLLFGSQRVRPLLTRPSRLSCQAGGSGREDPTP